jgi:hypothetical protein
VKQSLSPAGQAEIVLRPSSLKTLMYLAICLAFTAIGVLAVRTDGPVVGWLCLIVFGSGTIISLIQLLPGASYLHLSSDGFTYRSLFRTWPTIFWRDVSEFRAAYVSRGAALVVYDSNATSKPTLRKINRALVGATDGISASTYGLKAEELAEVMNAWRARHLSGFTE